MNNRALLLSHRQSLNGILAKGAKGPRRQDDLK
jgi:hypothetical protein